MDEKKIKTIADISVVLAGTEQAELKFQSSKDDIYAWVKRALNRFRFWGLSKKEKGVVRSYLSLQLFSTIAWIKILIS